jgi:AraC family transcriptional regulator
MAAMREDCGPLSGGSPIPVPDAQLTPRSSSGAGVDRTFFDRDAVSILRDSVALGWEGIYAAITEERPHETTRPPLHAMWLAMSLSDASFLRRFVLGQEHADPAIPLHSFTITPPGVVARDVIGTRVRALHLFVAPQVFAEVSSALTDRDRDSPAFSPVFTVEDPALIPLMRMLKQALFDPPREGLLKVDYLTRALAAHLLWGNPEAGRSGKWAVAAPALAPRQMQAIDEFIDSHLATDISIADLAHVVGLSRTQFLRRFKATTGSSPYRSVMEARVRRAKLLLGNGRLNLTEVAASSGFASQAHLATVFRRFVKVSPSGFRRQVCSPASSPWQTDDEPRPGSPIGKPVSP